MPPDTDTCDWPRCRTQAEYTYSVATPTVRLCRKHWQNMCLYRERAWKILKLKEKKNDAAD